MICTDPSLKGVVPADVEEYGGQTYHCTHEAHKEAAAAVGGADGASNLVISAAAVIASAYVLA